MRSNDEYNLGHITGAKVLPAKELSQRIQELESFKTKPLIVACQNGTSSMHVAKDLKAQAFQNVYVLHGGLNRWREAQFPLITGKAE